MIRKEQKYLDDLNDIKKFVDDNKGKPITLYTLLRKKYKWATTEASALIKTGIVEKIHTGGKGANYYYNWIGGEPTYEMIDKIIHGRKALYKQQFINKMERELIAKEEKNEIGKELEINTKKIGEFLRDLSPAERIYLDHAKNMSDNLINLIKEYNLTEVVVCVRFHIERERYEDFVKGNWNYTISDMSRLNTLYKELKASKLEADLPVKFND